VANKPTPSARRDAQLRGNHHRLDRGRLGFRVAAADGGHHPSAGRTLRSLANLILAPKEEAKRIATYIPRWGIWLAAHLVESKAWAIYRERLKRYASLIGDREPIVLQRQLPGMGSAMRYIITIADDDRRPLDKLCQKLTAADIACDVMRNVFGG
jgi:hypothetical protein